MLQYSPFELAILYAKYKVFCCSLAKHTKQDYHFYRNSVVHEILQIHLLIHHTALQSLSAQLPIEIVTYCHNTCRPVF